MKKLFILLIVVIYSIPLYSQKEAYNWFYGTKLGMTFNSLDSFPKEKKLALWGTDAASSISDRFGNLLFYTNGDVIFDRNNDTLGIINDTVKSYLKRHQKLDNDLNGSTIIIQKPCSENIYYVIHTMGDILRKTKMTLNYTTIDMNGRKGLGEIWDSKKLINKDVIPYVLTTTLHSDQQTVWLVTIEKGSGYLVFYKISKNGINYSHLNGLYSKYFKNKPYIGNIKFSANGDKIAISTRQKQILIFDFNNTTGLISNPKIINLQLNAVERLWLPDRPESDKLENSTGLEFSPNSSKLYGYGRQWDLSLPNDSAINASAYIFYDSLSVWECNNLKRKSIFYNYQLAPDGKIYMPWMDSVDVVSNPNEKDTLCNYMIWQDDGVGEIGPAYIERSESLPIFQTNYFKYQVHAFFNHDLCSKTNQYIEMCENESIQIFSNELKNSEYNWKGPSGYNSNQKDPKIDFIKANMSGWYVVKTTRRHDEISFDSVFIKVNPSPNAFIEPNGVISKCKYSDLLLEAKPHNKNYKYNWSTGSNDTSILIQNPGKYFLSITDEKNCTRLDSVEVLLTELYPQIEILGNKQNCIGDTVIIRTTNPFSKYIWSTGDSTREVKIYKTSRCYVEVIDDEGCAGVAEPVELVFNTLPKTVLKGPKSSCEGKTNKYYINKVYRDTVVWFVEGGDIVDRIGIDTILVHWATSGNKNIIVQQYSKSGCFTVDSMTVSISDNYDAKILPENPIICGDKIISLILDDVYEYYEWSTGDTTPEININLPGQYFVTVGDISGCIGYDTVEVIEGIEPTPSILGKTQICIGEDNLLTLNKTYEKYLWNTGDTTQSITVSTPGNYSVEITDSNGCKGTASIEVKAITIQLSGLRDVDFGKVGIGIDSEQTITLTNNTDEAVTINRIYSKNGTNEFVITTNPALPLTFAENENIEIDINFEPENLQEYIDSLVIEITSPCHVNYLNELSGIGTAKLLVSLPDIHYPVDTTICIPILGKLISSNNNINIKTTYNTTISYESSAFYPNIAFQKSGNDIQIKLENQELNIGTDSKAIGEICGGVLLANQKTTDLIFKEFTSINPYLEIETQDGSLTIDGCAIDLSRIHVSEQLEIVMKPNPVENILTVFFEGELNTNNIKGIIYNAQGIELYNFESTSKSYKNEFLINTTNFSNGIFQINFYLNNIFIKSRSFVVYK